MHEYSIIDSLLQIVEQHAMERGAKRVVKIEIKVGELSGVEPELLKTAFEVFREGTLSESAELVIHHQPVVVECEECGFNGELGKRVYRCPNCNSPRIKIVDGEEMYLTSIELEIEEESQ